MFTFPSFYKTSIQTSAVLYTHIYHKAKPLGNRFISTNHITKKKISQTSTKSEKVQIKLNKLIFTIDYFPTIMVLICTMCTTSIHTHTTLKVHYKYATNTTTELNASLLSTRIIPTHKIYNIL